MFYWVSGILNFRPAPGYRHPSYGTLYAVSQDGFNWSSSVNGSNARYLDFNYGVITPQNNLHRALGFPVRCLLE